MRKWIRRLLVLAAVLVFGFLFVLLPIGGSYLITNGRFRFPERGPTDPERLGLIVQPIEFSSADGVHLKGWWSDGRPGMPVIIFVHGLNRSRLELLERAAIAAEEGYGTLLFDLRNHGESAEAYTTLGVVERHDVCAASQYVARRSPASRQVVWGVSMGAVSALLSTRDCHRFSAAVSDASFLSLRETISHHFSLIFRLPAFPIANMIVALTGFRMGFDPDDGDVEAAVRSASDLPILFIAGAEDRRMPPDRAERLAAASTHPKKQVLLVPGAGHGDAFRTNPELYRSTVFSFLASVLERTPH